MTESREVLIEATANADREALKTTGASPYDEILDAILAHPVAVLDLLENAPCPTCGGTGERRIAERPESQGLYIYQCHTCSGSGVIGREGVFALLGWDLDALAGHLDACLDSLGHTDVSSREWLAEFAAPQPCGVCGVAEGQHRRLRPASRAVRDELLGVMARARDAHDGDDYDGAVLDALLASPRSVDALREAGMLDRRNA